MKSLADLDQLYLDPAVKSQVAALVRALLEETQQASAAEIARKDFKIEALTHELAYYKRIRFSTKSEALTTLQRDVFEETWNTDLSAIEAEIEGLTDPQPQRHCGQTQTPPCWPPAIAGPSATY